jgi:hypothetical protein
MLAIFLAQDGDDVEGGASGQADGDQFDGLGAGRSDGVIQQQVMAAAAAAHKLTLVPKWLSKSDFGVNHAFPHAPMFWDQPINAELGDLLQAEEVG